MTSLLTQALEGRNQKRPPVWLMRQAGRYMPSYQALRKIHSLGHLFRNPKLIAEVTLLPIHELNVDAAIIFSDILLPLETLGAAVHYPEKGAPWVEMKTQSASSLIDLPQAIMNLKYLDYLAEGIINVKHHLSVPLLGFCAAPFTLLSYLLDREDRTTFPNTFQFLSTNPKLFKQTLDDLAQLSIHYAKMQIQAGVEIFQLFESSGHVLSHEHCLLYSIPYLEQITHSLPVPCISFMKGSCKHIDSLQASSLPNVSFDYDLPMHMIRKQLGPDKTLQGNFSPHLLFENDSIIEEKTLLLLESMKHDPKFILNLGHGIMPGTPYQGVAKFVQVALNFKSS